MKSALLTALLGAWLGASLILVWVAMYNFSGFPDLFERNPKLAERAGFSVEDETGMKESLLWVHSSELNRKFFGGWERTQLVLGLAVIVLAALQRRRGLLVLVSTVLAVGIIAVLHLVLSPELVEIGRELDFTPRLPPPPELAEFQSKHGFYFVLDLVRLALVALALSAIIWQGTRKTAASAAA